MSWKTADLLLTGGRVWPGLGASIPEEAATAIAIAGGKILAIGTDLDGLADENTVRVDLGGRRVVPGLVDSHLHAIRAGLTYLDELDWAEVKSLADGLASIREAARTRPAGSWITVMGGWHPSQFPENRMPTRAELDAAAPDHPVFVHPLYGYEDVAVLNFRGLTEMGWVGNCPDPEEVVLFRDPAGNPDGRLIGLAAYQLIGAAAASQDPARARASTKAFFQRLASLGLTGVVDAGGLGMAPHRYHTVRELWRAGELPIRVRMNCSAVTRGDEPREIKAWQDYLDPGLGDDLLSVLGMGEVVHYGCHDWEGMVPFEISDAAFAEMTASLLSIAEAGWPLTLHAILDSSANRILDALETVAEKVPLAPLRWTLCHVECVSTRNLKRVSELGLGLTVQSRMVHKAAVCASRWGEDVLHHAPPLGDIVELGIPFGAGTDGTRSASYHPWRALWWFVTGDNVDGGPRRDERHRLDRATALDAYTRGSAWVSFEEDRRGVLVPGAYADLAVLSDDYFTVAEDEIPGITSELTIVGGRVVHASEAFAGVPVQQHEARPGPELTSR